MWLSVLVFCFLLVIVSLLCESLISELSQDCYYWSQHQYWYYWFVFV